MKSPFGDSTTFRDAFIHFLLADFLFAAFLGGSVEFTILMLLRGRAIFAFQGIGGIITEAVITWLSVMLSARLMRRSRQNDSIGIALMSTAFSLVVALIAIPYLQFFSDISHAPVGYLMIKEALHVSIFYSATIIYFSGMSVRELLKEYTSHAA